ncbi:hypothetical protein Bca4012_089198 [Brassica carinata]
MPRMHYGRRNTREYAQRRHYDMEGVDATFPEDGYGGTSLQGVARFQLAPKRAPRKHGRPCKPPSAAGGPPRVFTGKCQCGVLIKNAQEDRSVTGYTEDFINQAKLCKPKNAEAWCIWYKSGPLRHGGEEKIAADVALSSMEGGNRMVQKPRKVRDYLEEFLDTAKRCQPKPAEEWCHLFRAGLRGDIREELVGVLEPLEFALVRRMATKHCTRRSGWRKVRRRPSMIASQRAMKTLDPRPAAPRHVNVARRYPRDES